MSTVRVFKKGETLIKEGEKASSILLIQSGSVSVFLQRQKQNIDLYNLGSLQIVGEHALSGAATHPHSVIATTETKAVELPIEAVKAQIDAGSQLQKLMMKGLTDKLKVLMKDFQSMKLERDNTPCPPDQTSKIFGTIYHVAKTKGEIRKDKDGVESVVVSWPLMKQYAQRVFLESPKRLETATNIFVKLGWAKYEMVKNEDEPDEPEELGFVHFFDLAAVEQFFEFYQYYYFKGGKTELLKTDERVIQMIECLIEVSKDIEPDRRGAVRLDYSKIVDKVKEKMGLQLNSDHWTLIENKGLFVKRRSTDTGVFLEYDLKEFKQTAKIWRVLRETEKWNEKGYVDPNEPVNEVKKSKTSDIVCPACGHGFDAQPKFCSECGHKFVAAA